jgi:hypothetical protein
MTLCLLAISSDHDEKISSQLTYELKLSRIYAQTFLQSLVNFVTFSHLKLHDICALCIEIEHYHRITNVNPDQDFVKTLIETGSSLNIKTHTRSFHY